jgi:hypothetical protein
LDFDIDRVPTGVMHPVNHGIFYVLLMRYAASGASSS